MSTLRLFFLLIFFFGIFNVSRLSSQISPGPLTKAHADLEGMTNCTKCHTLGNKVSNDKCLECHKEINSRIKSGRGYHASSAIKGKACASCHSEHHGKNFEMIRFDTKSFDHKLTGYVLTGTHVKTDCRNCHKKDFVSESGLSKRPATYLGLSQQCANCHKDQHQQTLGNKCQDCHTTTAFVPASLFNHNRTKFPLTGKHMDVSCIECHPVESRKNESFQRFADIPFTNCNSCHDDPHKRKPMMDCKQCHVETSFKNNRQLAKFQHQVTGFPLKGSHARVDCFKCHTDDRQASRVFSDLRGRNGDDCVSCHADPHEGKFGLQCIDCHNETSFKQVRNLDEFNHNLTTFPLLGKHAFVDCRKCHTSDMTDPVQHQNCFDCHTDYHKGEFTRSDGTPDCADCHTESGFETSIYSIEEHNKSKFILDGAHLATPCSACHLKGEEWRFRIVGDKCTRCHENVHAQTIPEKYFPEGDCINCHLTSSWQESQFDHDLTEFSLVGRHREVNCRSCHMKDVAVSSAIFVNLQKHCSSCHSDTHNDQFGPSKTVDCLRCHNMFQWKIDDFNHYQTEFKLDGKHAQVACEKCHFLQEGFGQPYILYKTGKLECIDCHL